MMPAYAITSKIMEMVSSISLIPPVESSVSINCASVFDSAPLTIAPRSIDASTPW